MKKVKKKRHLTNWHKDFPKSLKMPYNTYIHTETL